MPLKQEDDGDGVVVFEKEDFPRDGFSAMEDIRRRGKLCDVTLKVSFRTPLNRTVTHITQCQCVDDVLD